MPWVPPLPSLSLILASPAAGPREGWKEGDILEDDASQLLLAALAPPESWAQTEVHQRATRPPNQVVCGLVSLPVR